MEGDHIKICEWLMPLSWLYGIGVGVRNAMFDSGMLHSESFDVPVICVGNITVGGTGKTPHTEYLIRLLKEKFQVAILSRGYKRKTKGYRLTDVCDRVEHIGDEPFQMKHKYPEVHVAVDADRRNGIRKLMNSDVNPPVDVVILDDAYQHRYVTPGLTILLMDYHRLVCFDKLLPAGRLREHKSNMRRADIVVVTKCPQTITPMERIGIERSLSLFPWQKIFFSYFKYGKLYPLFDKTQKEVMLENLADECEKVLLLTGIASPKQMEYDIKRHVDFVPMHYGDHHNFSKRDLRSIEDTFRKIQTGKKIIVTTEKDSVRLLQCNLAEDVARAIYVLPIEVDFMNSRAEEFNQLITGYVQKNPRDSRVSEKANGRKA